MIGNNERIEEDGRDAGDGRAGGGEPETEEGQGDDAEMDPEEEDQTRRVARIARAPREPSRAERHEISNLPARDWCAHCRRGRSIAGAHQQSGQERQFPVLSIDYAYIGIGKDLEEKMLEDSIIEPEEVARCLLCGATPSL